MMKAGYAALGRRVQSFCAFVLLLALASGLAAAADRNAEPAAAARKGVVLVMGDSLSAAYGMPASQGWVALTAARLADRHPGWRVVNASVSGETTAGGRSRIAGELRRTRPDVVVIELGANDGLRGLPLEQTRANLDAMVGAAKQAGAKVLLVGMKLPPNFGGAYTSGFERNYRTIADKHGVALLPFLLQPVVGDRAAFQGDNLHPTPAVQGRLRDHVWPALEPLLR